MPRGNVFCRLSTTMLFLVAATIILPGFLAGEFTTYKPAAPPAARVNFSPLPFQEEEGLRSLEELGAEETCLPVKAIRNLAAKNGADGILTLQDIPFALSPASKTPVLTREQSEFTMPVGKDMELLYLLFAITGPADENLLTCRIFREDGFTIRINWQTGHNVGPSTGEWEPDLDPDAERPATTAVLWEGRDERDRPVRIFGTTWVNGNPWYGINRLEWELAHPETRVILLGVTAGDYR